VVCFGIQGRKYFDWPPKSCEANGGTSLLCSAQNIMVSSVQMPQATNAVGLPTHYGPTQSRLSIKQKKYLGSIHRCSLCLFTMVGDLVGVVAMDLVGVGMTACNPGDQGAESLAAPNARGLARFIGALICRELCQHLPPTVTVVTAVTAVTPAVPAFTAGCCHDQLLS
jgi:hypothetical protein